jgi:phage terminase large subunit-like protein
VIPRRWRLNGRTQRLEPGSYRWYVWAHVGGRREGKATVQAKLVLPTR